MRKFEKILDISNNFDKIVFCCCNTYKRCFVLFVFWLNSERVPMIRKSLVEIYTNGRIDDKRNDLMIDKYAISVAYFRAGYTPRDYLSANDEEWKARELIEFSNAIKCPSIGYHLVGCKIMQTVFCDRNNLKEFLNDSESSFLLKFFVNLYSFDPKFVSNDKINSTIKMAEKSFKNFVLKPQREGGGNNTYGSDIPMKINQLLKNNENKDKELLSGYLLMQRIFPKEIDTILVRNGEAHVAKSISELGIYSAYLR